MSSTTHNNVTHISLPATTKCEEVRDTILNFVNDHPEKGWFWLWLEFGTSCSLNKLNELAIQVEALDFSHERLSWGISNPFSHTNAQGVAINVLEVTIRLY